MLRLTLLPSPTGPIHWGDLTGALRGALSLSLARPRSEHPIEASTHLPPVTRLLALARAAALAMDQAKVRAPLSHAIRAFRPTHDQHPALACL